MFLDKKSTIYINKTSLKYYFLAFFFGFIYVYFQNELLNIFDFTYSKNSNLQDITLIELFSKRNISSLIGIIIIIPISEELFFRKFIQKNLKNEYGSMIAILLATLLFSLGHLPDLYQILLVVFGGLISAILFNQSKSIGPSFIFHITWNLSVFILP
ncbi:CPBP family intramembrane glutamic endopeptidase [uncultured Winogradskyella sp.]|uniref:CPBP family intramembrane glutamic endopeptidase n=1 Tax=uncultured Winogradskyella sp. TaxID=395353 RepID=UPI002606C10E|nr:CPBP family intramembrane glutamic endopeptidase [uncultured Winogradskyella sp.]